MLMKEKFWTSHNLYKWGNVKCTSQSNVQGFICEFDLDGSSFFWYLTLRFMQLLLKNDYLEILEKWLIVDFAEFGVNWDFIYLIWGQFSYIHQSILNKSDVQILWLLIGWISYIFNQSNSNCLKNFGAKPKSMHYSFSSCSDIN